MATSSVNIEDKLIDIITSRPYTFEVGDRVFTMPYPTFGKILLIQKTISTHTNYGEEVNEFSLICRIIAMCVLVTKEDIMNPSVVSTLQNFFEKNLSLEEALTVYNMYKSMLEYEDIERAYGMSAERKIKERVHQAKKDSQQNTIVFGGKTILGRIVDNACERYGWSVDYILWDISYPLLTLLMEDASTSVYISDEEKRTYHISTDTDVISADDPKNLSKIIELFG